MGPVDQLGDRYPLADGGFGAQQGDLELKMRISESLASEAEVEDEITTDRLYPRILCRAEVLGV